MTLGKGLGWVPEERSEDEDFPIQTVLRDAKPVRHETIYRPMFNRPLDQGNEGTCVGFALKHSLLTGPVIFGRPEDDPSARQLYLEALIYDRWPNKTDMQRGTTLDAGAHALRARGFNKEWRHTWNVDEVFDFVLGVNEAGEHVGGTMILGVPWYSSMWDTNDAGFLKVSGTHQGFHAICASGGNAKEGWLWGPNSWGNKFGKRRKDGEQNGYWRIDIENMRKLFANRGHGVTFLQERLPWPSRRRS